MQILSYILSISGLIILIVASLIKGKRMETILTMVFISNLLVGSSYIVNGSGINGAASCFLGAAQSLINYFFDRKEKPLPVWLVIIYAVSFIAVNLAVGGFNRLCLLAIAACLSFIMCIGQKSSAKYRFWTLVNSVLWCLYDLLSKAWGGLVTHVSLLIFTAAGMLIHDYKKNKG